jgi:Domain of unknown function (DUF1902)
MMLPHRVIVVRAAWDSEARVWVATSDDLPGLVTESETVEELAAKLPGLVSDLLELNGSTSDLPEIPIHIIAEAVTRVANPRAA